MSTNKALMLRDIGMSFQEETLFKDIQLTIHSKDRLAIVGRNGAGKTTLLRILTQELQPTEGHIEYAGNMTHTYVEQIHQGGTHTVFEELEKSFHNLQRLQADMQIYEEKMANGDTSEEVLEAYGTLQEQFSHMGGYTFHNKIHQVLMGLNIPKEQWQQAINTLSGGERTKLNLGKVLLEEPDMMILDEPTNFLDMEAMEWLEYFLAKKWKKGLIVVSHDRHFLDRVTSTTLELITGRTPEHYSVPYSQYVTQREKRIELLWKNFKKQEEEILRQEEIIRRLRAGSRASTAQSRMKMLDKVERLDRPPVDHTPRITFKKTEDSSDTLYNLQDMFVGYNEDNPLYYINHIQLRKGQRVGILGPNGAGKTTLLKIITRQIRPLSGSLTDGKNVIPGYYSQTMEHLSPEKTILEEIFDFAKDFTREQVRSFMGQFLFYGDDIFKKIIDLSGGERARVALAKLSLTPTNLLIMDEPTNHLDYVVREALEDALQRYHGSVLFISHDRYFIDKIATHLWRIDEESGELKEHSGNYTDYMDQKDLGRFEFESFEQEAGELLMGSLEKFENPDEFARATRKWKK